LIHQHRIFLELVDETEVSVEQCRRVVGVSQPALNDEAGDALFDVKDVTDDEVGKVEGDKERAFEKKS